MRCVATKGDGLQSGGKAPSQFRKGGSSRERLGEDNDRALVLDSRHYQRAIAGISVSAGVDAMRGRAGLTMKGWPFQGF